MDLEVSRNYFKDMVDFEEEMIKKLQKRINKAGKDYIGHKDPRFLAETSPDQLPDSFYALKGLRKIQKLYEKKIKRDRKILAALDENESYNIYKTISRLSYKGVEDIYTSSSINDIQALMGNVNYLILFLSNEKNIKFLSSKSKRLAYDYREAIFSQESSCKIAFSVPKFVEMVLRNRQVLGEVLKHPASMREFELSSVVYGILSHGNVRELETLFVTDDEGQILNSTSNLKLEPARLTDGPILVIGAYYATNMGRFHVNDDSLITTYENYISDHSHLIYPNGSVIVNYQTIRFNMKKLTNGGCGRMSMIPIMKVCNGVKATSGIVLNYITLPNTI